MSSDGQKSHEMMVKIPSDSPDKQQDSDVDHVEDSHDHSEAVAPDSEDEDKDEGTDHGYTLLPHDEPVEAHSPACNRPRSPQPVAPPPIQVAVPNKHEEPLKIDEEKSDQIVKAMAGFHLPASSTPSWANDVPEHVWKDDLLAKLRSKQS